MKDKNKMPKTTKEILLMLLRKKQSKGFMPYLTTKDTSYKIFRWSFFVCVIICTFINLFYILGTLGKIDAMVTYKNTMGTEIEPHQKLEIEYMYTSVNIMVVSTFGIILSEIFVWLKRPLLQMLSCIASSITIIVRMNQEIIRFAKDTDPNSNTLTNNQIIPLVILCLCCIVSASIHLRQLYKDKKGCEEISEIIYKKYGAIAKDISPDEWDDILAEYDPEKTSSKKRSVKNRIKKQKAKDEKENAKEDNKEDTKANTK